VLAAEGVQQCKIVLNGRSGLASYRRTQSQGRQRQNRQLPFGGILRHCRQAVLEIFAQWAVQGEVSDIVRCQPQISRAKATPSFFVQKHSFNEDTQTTGGGPSPGSNARRTSRLLRGELNKVTSLNDVATAPCPAETYDRDLTDGSLCRRNHRSDRRRDRATDLCR